MVLLIVDYWQLSCSQNSFVCLVPPSQDIKTCKAVIGWHSSWHSDNKTSRKWFVRHPVVGSRQPSPKNSPFQDIGWQKTNFSVSMVGHLKFTFRLGHYFLIGLSWWMAQDIHQQSLVYLVQGRALPWGDNTLYCFQELKIFGRRQQQWSSFFFSIQVSWRQFPGIWVLFKFRCLSVSFGFYCKTSLFSLQDVSRDSRLGFGSIFSPSLDTFMSRVFSAHFIPVYHFPSNISSSSLQSLQVDREDACKVSLVVQDRNGL